MKKILLLIFLFCMMHGYAQNISELRFIDSLVIAINNGNFFIQHDSIIQDYPKLGLNMKTYLTMVKDQNILKKFVNHVVGTREENGVKTQMNGWIAFYYDQNKLIKVEEFGIEGEKDHYAGWYFAGDKLFYSTMGSESAADRANELLSISDNLIKKSQVPGGLK